MSERLGQDTACKDDPNWPKGYSHHTTSPSSIKVKKEETGKGRCLLSWKWFRQRLGIDGKEWGISFALLFYLSPIELSLSQPMSFPLFFFFFFPFHLPIFSYRFLEHVREEGRERVPVLGFDWQPGSTHHKQKHLSSTFSHQFPSFQYNP